MTTTENIRYVSGDATAPFARPALIAHVCNDEGKWGRGFVLALSRRWSEPEGCYRMWHAAVASRPIHDLLCEETGEFGLGQSQLVEVDYEGIYVLNMVAQKGVSSGERAAARRPAVRYDALALCLRHAERFARRLGAGLHMPRIGCGLGGGTWKEVEPLIKRLTSAPVTVYDLPGTTQQWDGEG